MRHIQVNVTLNKCLCFKMTQNYIFLISSTEIYFHDCTFSIPRFKQRVSFYVPEFGNLYAVLDSVKVADSLLCVLSPQGGMDEYGEQLLRCLFGQGIPAVTFVTQVNLYAHLYMTRV